jgi:hypothetical protein
MNYYQQVLNAIGISLGVIVFAFVLARVYLFYLAHLPSIPPAIYYAAFSRYQDILEQLKNEEAFVCNKFGNKVINHIKFNEVNAQKQEVQHILNVLAAGAIPDQIALYHIAGHRYFVRIRNVGTFRFAIEVLYTVRRRKIPITQVSVKTYESLFP